MSNTEIQSPEQPAEQPQPTPTDVATTSPAQEAPIERATPKDRLKARKIKRERVNLADKGEEELWVEVRGLTAGTAFDMADDVDEEDEEDNKKQIPVLLRHTVFDVDTDSAFFDDGWDDDEIMELPIDVVNKLAAAANYVLGRGPQPGKD